MTPQTPPSPCVHARARLLAPLVLVLVLAFAASPACGGSSLRTPAVDYDLVQVAGVYTQTNLHPDPTRSLLYSVNYQRKGLIPYCTEVVIESVTRSEMRFVVAETGHRYTWRFHKATRDARANLDRYFGTTCDPTIVDDLPDDERDAVIRGLVRPGMSKAAVVLAIGFPPPHRTATLDLPTWTYWRSRFDTFDVEFDADGYVTRVRN